MKEELTITSILGRESKLPIIIKNYSCSKLEEENRNFIYVVSLGDNPKYQSFTRSLVQKANSSSDDFVFYHLDVTSRNSAERFSILNEGDMAIALVEESRGFGSHKAAELGLFGYKNPSYLTKIINQVCTFFSGNGNIPIGEKLSAHAKEISFKNATPEDKRSVGLEKRLEPKLL